MIKVNFQQHLLSVTRNKSAVKRRSSRGFVHTHSRLIHWRRKERTIYKAGTRRRFDTRSLPRPPCFVELCTKDTHLVIPTDTSHVMCAFTLFLRLLLSFFLHNLQLQNKHKVSYLSVIRSVTMFVHRNIINLCSTVV